jgi:hypothetical protein
MMCRRVWCLSDRAINNLLSLSEKRRLGVLAGGSGVSSNAFQ